MLVNRFITHDKKVYIVKGDVDNKGDFHAIDNNGNLEMLNEKNVEFISSFQDLKKIDVAQYDNFCFLVTGHSNSRVKMFMGSILPFSHFKTYDDDGEILLYIYLKTFRDDIDSLQVESYNLECIIRTKSMRQQHIIDEGDQVKIVKKSKYTKQKKIDIHKDIFIFKESFEDVAMIEMEKRKFYVPVKQIKKVK